jgi:hypothetical protein
MRQSMSTSFSGDPRAALDWSGTAGWPRVDGRPPDLPRAIAERLVRQERLIRGLRDEVELLEETIGVLQETIRGSTRLAVSLQRALHEKDIRIRELENTVRLLESLLEDAGRARGSSLRHALRVVTARESAPPTAVPGRR